MKDDDLSLLLNKQKWITYASSTLFLSTNKEINMNVKQSNKPLLNENNHNILLDKVFADKYPLKTVAKVSTNLDPYLAAPSAICCMQEAKKEAELILCYCLKIDKVTLLMHKEFTITTDQKINLEECLSRRAQYEPLAYIFGKKEFFSLDFIVNKHTLIPRPETEMLTEEMLIFVVNEQKKRKADTQNHNYYNPIHILDLGCGTGCISLSFLKNSTHTHAFLCDISNDTLNVAKENAILHNLEKNCTFLLGDFTNQSFTQELTKTPVFDIIVSNPPYIPESEYKKLHSSVNEYEPEIALVSKTITNTLQLPPTSKQTSSKENTQNKLNTHAPNQNQCDTNALFHIQAVIKIAEKYLKPQGLLLIEHGYNQGEAVRALCDPNFFSQVTTQKDYGNIPRYLKAYKK